MAKKQNKTKENFYVTTPIYYPSGKPHIGSAYTTLAADILARWHKLLGKDVFFLTGTDEHTKKVVKVAKAEGKTPKEYTDYITPIFQNAWKRLGIKYDRFIRTTDKEHEKVVSDILKKVYKKEKDAKIRERILMIIYTSQKETLRYVAERLHCDHKLVFYWKRRYEKEGFVIANADRVVLTQKGQGLVKDISLVGGGNNVLYSKKKLQLSPNYKALAGELQGFRKKIFPRHGL